MNPSSCKSEESEVLRKERERDKEIEREKGRERDQER